MARIYTDGVVHRTHCALRLGDNLLALHLLRGLAKAYPGRVFMHYAHLQYLPQLIEVVCDLPNLQVCNIEIVAEPGECPYWEMAPRALLGSVDLWKNAGGYWAGHPLRLDYAQFALAYGQWVADRLNQRAMDVAPMVSPWREVQDLAFDYPALLAGKAKLFDVLVINSAPQSGQAAAYNAQEMTALVAELARRYVVVTTAPTGIAGVGCTLHQGMTVTGVGILSRFCRVIVMVSTGPSWPTFNVWNRESVKHRIILLEPERVELAPNTVHVSNAADARRMLQVRGVL